MAGHNVCKVEKSFYDYEWEKDKSAYIISYEKIIKQVVYDVFAGISNSVISGRFHNTLIRLFTDLCQRAKEDTQINIVALSGGVFLNSIIFKGLIDSLQKRKFRVLTHGFVPTGDGGISLGQAVVAGAGDNIAKVLS